MISTSGHLISKFPEVRFHRTRISTVLFLVVMNWFDGIIIDRIWVGHSKIWKIKGMEGVPYVKSWKTIFTRRGLGTLLYLIIAFAVAGIVVLLGKNLRLI